MNKQIIIIGAGASGLLASIFLRKKNYDVLVLEKNTKAARKILASGNGKCNITNQNINANFFNTSSNKSFFNYLLNQMTYEKVKSIFSNLGLEMVLGDGTKMYPMSMQASSVGDILYNEALSIGVKFKFNEEVVFVNNYNNTFEIKSEHNTYKSTYLVIASGSAAMKKLGSSDSGYTFAKKFNHKIVNTFASLVQLKSSDKFIFSLSGVKTKANVSLIINNKKIRTLYGDILFTKYGVSGNTILDLSREASQALFNTLKVDVICDVMPALSKEELLKLLINRKKLLSNKSANFLLESIVNTKLIKYIYLKANINSEIINKLSKQDISNIVNVIKNIKIKISDTNGLENAEVVAGGVSLDKINSKSMESMNRKNLYFCGEVLDVDGDCGGYNFHWAWGSAYILSNSFKYIDIINK